MNNLSGDSSSSLTNTIPVDSGTHQPARVLCLIEQTPEEEVRDFLKNRLAERGFEVRVRRRSAARQDDLSGVQAVLVETEKEKERAPGGIAEVLNGARVPSGLPVMEIAAQSPPALCRETRTKVFEVCRVHLDPNHSSRDGGGVSLTNRLAEAIGRAQVDATSRCTEAELLAAEENEKHRLGRDLHDSVCQHLAGIRMMLETVTRRIEKEVPAEAACLAEIETHLNDSIRTARALSHGLAPRNLQGEHLTRALTEYAMFIETMFQVKCDISVEVPDAGFSEKTSIHLFRIVQEAVQNAIRHGDCRLARVSIRPDGGSMVLAISDDGLGFSHGNGGAETEGSGLQHMRFRSREIQGALEILSQPGKGTTILCRFPKPAPETQREAS